MSDGVHVRLGPVRLEVGRGVYATVLLMAVLAVATTKGPISLFDAGAAVVGSTAATYLAHLFAGVLAELNNPAPTVRGARMIVLVARADADLLLVAVLPVAVLLLSWAARWATSTAVLLIMALAVVFLATVGGLGGRRAGLGRGGVAASAGAATVLGSALLVVHVLLKT